LRSGGHLANSKKVPRSCIGPKDPLLRTGTLLAARRRCIAVAILPKRRFDFDMVAKAGEKAWETGTFKCQVCNAEVRVQKCDEIPSCPNGHKTYDERVDEPGRRD
jgi:hypothetical protein